MDSVIQHGKLMRDVLDGRMLGQRTGGRRLQMVDDLLEKKNYTDLRKQLKIGHLVYM